MTAILALDTSTEYCSVALSTPAEVIARGVMAGRAHSRHLLAMIDAVLVQANLSRSALDVIACCCGPGSFTGVRIGLGVAQGLGVALDRPLALVSTLAVLAQGAIREHAAGAVLSALDARMEEVYWGAFRRDHAGLAQAVIAERVIPPEQATPPGADAWIGVGPGFARYSNRLACYGCCKAIEPERFPNARDALLLAERVRADGGLVSAEQARPTYLRNRVT